ncbi:MAG: hypothetical protein DPW22_00520 [Alphaproteobacteria bacterium]|nr:hypothetical protein [Alphaproteobacteria bacterium]
MRLMVRSAAQQRVSNHEAAASQRTGLILRDALRALQDEDSRICRRTKITAHVQRLFQRAPPGITA